MRFKRSIKAQNGLGMIAVVPLMNIFFLLLVFWALAFVLTSPAVIDVQLPKTMTGDVIRQDPLVIAVTGENVIHVDNKIVGIKELKSLMGRTVKKNLSVLIKADRRASVGRLVDVWNICRGFGIERVNIATDQEQ